MKRVSWKYLAGLVDGEGCIDLQVQKGQNRLYVRPRLRIAMADVAFPLLEMCQANFGGHLEKRQAVNANHQDSSCWTLAGYTKACPILRNIVNHLFIKREQARFCLWMEPNIKGKPLTQECVDALRNELKLAKRDLHRLSEQAQEVILGML